ncbi:hypothetical protein [uncultured Chitinophaga sp.]|uniref:hypothetical protein n=1 Tax=uncultured Chitinophaga sp. TaxID=339340 RepID=UPI0025CFA060|nr:hypothetical protein [uncultured Chitinophaga sp.]
MFTKFIKRFYKYHPKPLPDLPGIDPATIIPSRPEGWHDWFGLVLDPQDFHRETIARLEKEGFFERNKVKKEAPLADVPPHDTGS